MSEKHEPKCDKLQNGKYDCTCSAEWLKMRMNEFALNYQPGCRKVLTEDEKKTIIALCDLADDEIRDEGPMFEGWQSEETKTLIAKVRELAEEWRK